ncbi:hypothetical protein [Azospirillum rugosum]|uniref:Uncharacterized protein n=1 Tax=Azospirillum rugosum TaxID=416170 RepID=A0ABS4SVW0_9PROT|nr:hypothetical protein [Azospirillum rugosum]MBP2296699.1 hypothetical protein [Azospirillum rugosum]MDQ0530488.1 hypothetical protein [Azospirillum rugosum]
MKQNSRAATLARTADLRFLLTHALFAGAAVAAAIGACWPR